VYFSPTEKEKEVLREQGYMYNNSWTLLYETRLSLHEHGKTPEDILWVGSPSWGWMTWEEFEAIASRITDQYTNDVADDFVIVGDGWWFMRMTEMEGHQWWQLITPPVKPSEHKTGNILSRWVMNDILVTMEKINPSPEEKEIEKQKEEKYWEDRRKREEKQWQ